MNIHVNIIMDSRRPEKYDPLMETLKRQGITDYTIWPAILKDTVIESINSAHKMIVWDAREKGLEMCCIWEEDCMIPDQFGWRHFLEGIPVWPWDIYLAGTYGLDRPVRNPIHGINGLHCYLINARFYDTFLSLPSDKHIDTCMDGLGLFYVDYPFTAIQRPGWSANSKAFSNKNAELTNEDVYGGLPKY